jgi:polysaccharide export outer membrane protein
MRMDEHSAVARGRAERKDPEYRVRLISANLIAQLAEQRVRERALVPDPLGGQPLAPYTIAPYDVLQITVWGHPELTAPTGQFRSPEENGVPVLLDGTIFYPYVGVVDVAGRTVAEIRAILTQRLARVVASPQLEVRIAAFRGRRVQVTGEVLQPSVMFLSDLPLRVQDAIAFARGLGPEADPTNVILTRGGKAYSLDMLAYYERGDATQNWLLKDGDVVNVADRNANRVFVMGEVKHQQAKLMVKRRMTLAEALGESDGVDPVAANVAFIYVIRGDLTAPDIFRLNASSADALLLATHFQLRPRDVVYVATYELTRFNRVMSQILPTIETLYSAAVTIDIAARRP